MNRIECQQFIFGKLTKTERARYEVIARSQGVTDEYAEEVRQVFGDCLPTSVKIPSFTTAYVAAPIDGEHIALLRIERSTEEEKARGHFIQEHYVIIKKENLLRYKTKDHILSKPWIWLLNIPSIPHQSEYKKLQNLFDWGTEDNIIVPQIEKFFRNLITKEVDGLHETLGAIVYQLLNNPPVAFIVEGTNPQERKFWTIALSLLLPASEVCRLKMFLGDNPPRDWKYDLLVVKNRMVDEFVHTVTSSEKPAINRKHLPAYSSLLQRCLDLSESGEYVNQLSQMIDDINVDKLTNKISSSRDDLVGFAAMPTIGLDLIRREVDRGKILPDDLQWIWRNEVHNLVANDFIVLFPSLVNNIDMWEVKDFEILGHSLERLPQILETAIISLPAENKETPKFLMKWNKYRKFSEKENEIFMSVIFQLANLNFIQALEIFLEWLAIQERSNDEKLENSRKIISFQNYDNLIKPSHFWRLFTNLAISLTKINQFGTFINFLASLQLEQSLIETQKALISLYNYSESVDIQLPPSSEVFRNLEDAIINSEIEKISRDIFIFALFHLSIIKRNVISFVILTKFISTWETLPNKLPAINNIINDWEEDVYIWALKVKHPALIGSLMYIGHLIEKSENSREFLAEVLRNRPELFSKVINFMVEKLCVSGVYLQISLDMITTYKLQEQLYLLALYIETIYKYTWKLYPDVLEMFLNILETSPNISKIPTPLQKSLIYVLEKEGFITIAQRLVEHQIRHSLASETQKIRVVRENIDHLKHLLQKNKKQLTNYLKSEIVKSYLAGLSPEGFSIFRSWFLNAPMSQPYQVENLPHYFITVAILKKNITWLEFDLGVRIRIFEELLNNLEQKKSP